MSCRQLRLSLPLATVLLLLPAAARADLRCGDDPVGFDLGVPEGWTVAPAIGGVAWSDLPGCREVANVTGGTGGAACASSDRAGHRAYDTSFGTSLHLLGVSTATLRFRLNYQRFSATEGLNVEVSRDGVVWEPARVFLQDAGSFRAADGEIVDVDLSPWAGEAALQLRFRYHNDDLDAWDWYVQVDDVALACDPAPPCGPGALRRDRLADGGFEAGTPSVVWSESSAQFGTPLCTAGDCGAPLARSGRGFAFFGGSLGAVESASLEQPVVVHPGPASLELHLWKAAASGNGDDAFRVLVDGVELTAVREDRSGFASGYRQLQLDVSAFADGGSHLLRLEATTDDLVRPTSFLVDDVALYGCPDVAAAPELTIADATVLEGSGGASTLVELAVTLSHPWPSPVAVDWATADGSTVAGEDYDAASGRLHFAAGETAAVLALQVRGDDAPEGDEQLRIVLSAASGATVVDDTAIVTILDDDQELRVADVTVAEGDFGTGTARFVVNLSAPSAHPVTVDFATAAGSAAAGADFVSRQGTLVFQPGQDRAVVDVAVVGDQVVEGDEAFSLVLTNAVGVRLVDGTAEATIRDDDVAEIHVEDAVVVEGDAGASPLVFVLRLSRASALPVSVSWATVAGSATPGEDFAAAAGTVVFAPGAQSTMIGIDVLGDLFDEEDESFSIVLSASAGASLADAEATGTILDDDTLVISIGDASLDEARADGEDAVFAVTLEGASREAIEVSWATRDGSATAGVDYVAASGVLVIAPASVATTIAVEVLPDGSDERDETFFVDLAAPTLGRLDRATATGTIVDDDGVVADAGGSYAGAEGEPILLDGIGSFHPDGTIVAYAWDTDDDGQFDDATGVTAQVTFPDEGTFTVALRVTDDAGEVDTDIATVTVANVAPSVDAGQDAAIDEGGALELTATFADAGTADLPVIRVEWGDGESHESTATTSTGIVSGEHTYADDGRYAVRVCADDGDGGNACDELEVTVANVAPAFEDDAETIEVPEGDVAELLLAFTDPGADEHEAAIAWGDGAAGPGAVTAGGRPVALFTDDFDDEAGGRGALNYTGFASWTVEDGSVDVIGNGYVDLQPGNGLYVDLDGSTGNAGRLRSRPLSLAAGAYSLRFSLAGSQRGTQTDTVVVRLGDLYVESFTLAASVPFTPVVRWVTVPSDRTLDLTFDHSGGDYIGLLLDHVSVSRDCGLFGVCGFVSAGHVYRDDLVETIDVCVRDDDGGEGCRSVPVRVSNVPPALEVAAEWVAPVGEPAELRASFGDPGAGDTHEATIEWGDGGASPAVVAEDEGSGTLVAEHVYAAAGTYTLRACVVDDDGGETCELVTVTARAAELDLAAELRASSLLARVGEEIELAVVVRNEGSRVAHGIVVTQDLPPGLTPLAASDGGTLTAGRVTWHLASLSPPDEARFTVTLRVPETAPIGDEVVTTASVVDDGRFGPDVDPADNTTSLTLRLADLTEAALDAGPDVVGVEGEAVALAARVDAGVTRLLDDSFDEENGGVGILNYFGLVHWDVIEGTIDVIGNGFADYLPGNGLYLDLDGSTGNAATMRSRRAFRLGPGRYRLSFDLAGNQRGGSDTMILTAGTFYLEAFSRPASAPLARVERVFDLATPQTVQIAWNHFGNDWIGMLLDDVLFERVCDRTAVIDWGDGATETAPWSCETALATEHVYKDDGVYTVRACVLGPQGEEACDSTRAVIANAAPDVDVTAPSRVAPGESLALTGTFTDAGVLDTHVATVAWGDGDSGEATIEDDGGSGTLSAAHSYVVAGERTIRVCVTDDDGGEGCADHALVVGDPLGPPVLLLGKRVTDALFDGAAEPGEALLYTLDLTNTGETSAVDVRVVDPLPELTTLVANSVTTTSGTILSEDPVTVAIPALGPGETVTVRFQVTVTGSPPPGSTEVRNQAVASAADLADVLSDDPDQPGAADPTVLPLGARPVLVASKVDQLVEDAGTDGVASPGDVLGYRVEVANVGRSPATEVVLHDVLAPVLAVVPGSIAGDGVVVQEDPLRVDLGDLAPGERATVDFAVVIADLLPPTLQELVNQASLSSGELPVLLTDDPDVAGRADPTVTPLTLAPRLVASKTDALAADADADGVASPGDTLAYAITIRNLGNAGATGVGFVDLVPEHTTLVAGSVATSAGTIDAADAIEVTLGELAAGGEATVAFEVVVASPLPAGVTQVVNQGGIVADGQDEVLTDDPDAGGETDPTVTEISAAPVLVVEKSDLLFADPGEDGVASPGDELLYTIAVRNTGNAGATAVVLHDDLPEGLALVAGSVQASQGAVVSEAPIAVALGGVAGGETATVTFRVVVADPFPAGLAAVANQAALTSAELAEVASDDPATEPVGDPTVTEVFARPPVVGAAGVMLLEGDAGTADAVFVLVLDRPSSRPTSVAWATADETATAGADYEAATGVATFAPGATETAVVVAVLGDLTDEPNEDFVLNLAEPDNAVLGDAVGRARILDDDDPPALALGDVAVEEGDTGLVVAAFPATLARPSGFDVALSYATADGTARGGEDYLPAQGTLTIPVGAAGTAIEVAVLGDVVDERDETFTLHLGAVDNATLADADGTATIVDDDEARLSIGDVAVEEGDAGTTPAVFRVELSTPADREVSAAWATVADTATEGEDYLAAAGTVTLAPLALAASIAVDVVGDALLEDDESFRVELLDPVETSIADAVGVGTILDDEVCLGPELLVNPGAEDRPVGGQLPGWTKPAGADWERRFAPPDPVDGRASFAAGTAEQAELVQEVDVAAYAALIDAGGQAFAFEAHVRTADEVPLDVVRVVVEHLDADGAVLDAYDSGEVVSPFEWHRLGDVRLAPPSTRLVRVRLLATRFAGATTDAYFDALSLRSLRAATVSVDDVAVAEGDAGTRDAAFTVRLACAWEHAVTVTYATSDVTAVDGEDYLGVEGSVTFPPGITAQTIAVPVLGDAVDEPHEHFLVELGDLASDGVAVLLDPFGVGTILGDDWCPRTPGYWKTHREAWPVGWLELGGVEIDDATMMAYLSAGGSDAATRLAHHLVATKLNLARGSDPDLVAPSILVAVAEADAFLAVHPPGSNPTGPVRDEANRLKDLLDRYDNLHCGGD